MLYAVDHKVGGKGHELNYGSQDRSHAPLDAGKGKVVDFSIRSLGVVLTSETNIRLLSSRTLIERICIF